MICGALQTLNEEAFEDVIASERPSPTGGPSTGETIALDMNMQTLQQSQQQPLTPIQETVEIERSLVFTHGDASDHQQSHPMNIGTAVNNATNNNNNNNNLDSVINNNNNNNNNHHNINNNNLTNNNNDDSLNRNSSVDNKSTTPTTTSTPPSPTALANTAIGKSNNTRSRHMITDATMHDPIHINAKYCPTHTMLSMPHTLSASSTSLPSPSLVCSASIPLTTNTSFTNQANDKQTTISITPPSPSASTIILMPGVASIDSKTFVDDTRL